MTDTLAPAVADMLMDGPAVPVDGPIEMPVNIAPGVPSQQPTLVDQLVGAADQLKNWPIGTGMSVAGMVDLSNLLYAAATALGFTPPPPDVG